MSLSTVSKRNCICMTDRGFPSMTKRKTTCTGIYPGKLFACKNDWLKQNGQPLNLELTIEAVLYKMSDLQGLKNIVF